MLGQISEAQQKSGTFRSVSGPALSLQTELAFSLELPRLCVCAKLHHQLLAEGGPWVSIVKCSTNVG
jgi:hypothetical protein